MGQKVNPIGFRLAVTKDWRSKWYAPEKEFADALHSDLKIRKYLKDKLMQAAVAKIVIERAWNLVRVTLHTARPGLVIGRKGQEIDVMSQAISEMCGGKQVKIDIFEIKQPELDATLVAEGVAVQLERRISFDQLQQRYEREWRAEFRHRLGVGRLLQAALFLPAAAAAGVRLLNAVPWLGDYFVRATRDSESL